MKKDVNWTEERKYFKRVTETTSLIAWATDTDGQCFYLSPAWYEFTGMSEGDGIGFNWLTSLHPDDIDRVRQAFFSANDSRIAFGQAYRLSRADGEYHHVWDVGFPKFDDEGIFQGFFGTTCTFEQVQNSGIVVPPEGEICPQPVLTPREREILTLISDGNTTDTVAAILGIAGRTVDSHVASAGIKLGATNRVHTVARAMRLNEI